MNRSTCLAVVLVLFCSTASFSQDYPDFNSNGATLRRIEHAISNASDTYNRATNEPKDYKPFYILGISFVIGMGVHAGVMKYEETPTKTKKSSPGGQLIN